jgi:hypothetical protein
MAVTATITAGDVVAVIITDGREAAIVGGTDLELIFARSVRYRADAREILDCDSKWMAVLEPVLQRKLA